LIVLIIITLLAIFLSFIADKKKTIEALKRGSLMFLKLLPKMLNIIILISIILYFVSKEFLITNFGSNPGIFGYVMAAITGSITLIPGFIAYPICGYLIKNGVGYPIIAVFITTLMMVGIATIPIEKQYFGLKATILRNGLSLIGAFIVSLLIGLLWNII